MSNTAKRSKRSKSHNRSHTHIDVIEGAYHLIVTVGASSPAALLLSPGVFPRSNSVGSVFQNYRFTRINIRMLPLSITSSNPNNFWVLGYSSDVSSGIASITSSTAISECTPSGIQGIAGGTANTSAFYPTAKVNLNRSTLCGDGSLKWWKCIGDSDTNQWENFQGQLLFYNDYSSSVAFQMWVTYTIEFTSPISSLLTKMVPWRIVPVTEDSRPKSSVVIRR